MTYRIILIACFGWCWCAGATSASENIPPKRLSRLEKAMESLDSNLHKRALDELGWAVAENETAQRILIDQLFTKSVWWIQEEVAALSRGDERVALKVMAACEDPNVSDRESRLENALVLWGRMQLKARAVAPYLLQQLPRYSADPNMEGHLRVVLANVGYPSDENLSIILSDLKHRTSRGCAEIVEMARCGAGAWVTDEIIAALIPWLEVKDVNEEETEIDTYADVSLVLASLGTRAYSAEKYLKKHLNYEAHGKKLRQEEYNSLKKNDSKSLDSLENRHAGYDANGPKDVDKVVEWPVVIIYNLALARIGPNEAPTALKNILSYWYHCPNKGHIAANALDSSKYLFDANLIAVIGKYLDDPNTGVAATAAEILDQIGSDARRFKSNVLRTLKTSPHEKVREASAGALATLADPVDIPALQEALQQEKSENVQNQIKEAIRIIRLEEQ
jgi:hypothetical protein